MITRHSHSFIELPRNFQFISRLPSRFLISVLSEKNVTPKGIWYEIIVDGHKLNILSHRKLVSGKKYLVQKKGSIYLEVVDEKSKNENIKESNTKKISSTLKDANSLQKSVQGATISFEDLVSDFTFLDFFTSMAVTALKEEENLSISQDVYKVRFSIRPMLLDFISGVFMKEQDGYRLYLTSTQRGQSFLKRYTKNLNDLLNDLKIKSIHIIPESKLDHLKSRIDIEI